MNNSELRKLAEAATPGPWEAVALGNDSHPSEVWFSENMRVCLMPSNVNGKNAAYIAAANPKTVLELLDRIAELEGAVKLERNAGIESALKIVRECEEFCALQKTDAPPSRRSIWGEKAEAFSVVTSAISAMVRP